ncbi:peptidase family M13 [Gleimia coleocanis DSM 15436]|uniref:Peptidase family M13 n=1 Tax=Gleimia coleocanis DSM 15436 TaxID=525245 RepID=C0W1C6_9ACTO|nr:M13 family metallopeptidase [Gleimia coleocanis]EEH63615.1 peptidase family M13 [Gleimia coleocanis DSM 15436]
MSNIEITPVFDPEIADKNVLATEDFFRHANGAWLENHEIPGDRPSDGAFYALRDASELAVREIVENLSVDSTDANEAKIAVFFQQFMDEDTVNAAGVTPLAADFSILEAAENHEELLAAIAKLEASGVSGFGGFYVYGDLNAPERYALYLDQGGLSLPDEAFYREENYGPIREAFVNYLNTAASLIKDQQVSELASLLPENFGETVLAFETELAKHHWDKVTCRDAQKANNPFTLGQLSEKIPAFPWVQWLNQAGANLTADSEVIVSQPSFWEGFAQLWADTDLQTLKLWLVAHIIAARSAYLHQEMVDNNFNFSRVLTGATEQRPRWKRAISFVEGAMGEGIGELYVNRHFPADYKEKMLVLVNNLIEAYRQSISELDWMGEETRQRALEKLSKFRAKIGYPDKFEDYSALQPGTTLVESVRNIAAFVTKREMAKIAQPVDLGEWLMTPQTVNAYYMPTGNEIVFPAAILQPPFFHPDMTDAVNYGAIGAVIGHEIGHGFDDQGAQYDGTGQLNNWWEEADEAEFKNRTKALIDQYAQYSPAQLDDEYKVNGELTIGENIGDLGGITIGWKAYQLALAARGIASHEEDVHEGLNGAQQFLYSWARIWRSKARNEYLQQLLTIDPHSPAEFRCNGILRNFDLFHETFGTQPGDGMWMDPADRVKIW